MTLLVAAAAFLGVADQQRLLAHDRLDELSEPAHAVRVRTDQAAAVQLRRLAVRFRRLRLGPPKFGWLESDGSGPGGSSSSSASGAPTDVTSIASSVDPALVDINVTLGYKDDQAAAAATGIVLTSNGEVLTNNHVITGATSISATDVGNGRTYKATVVGYDRSKDIAVIQLSGASGLKTGQDRRLVDGGRRRGRGRDRQRRRHRRHAQRGRRQHRRPSTSRSSPATPATAPPSDSRA